MKKISFFKLLTLIVTVTCLLTAVGYVLRLDNQITSRFEGRRWELPARIYARSLELYLGKILSSENLEKELLQLRYSRVKSPEKSGEYSIQGHRFTIYSRNFPFPDILRPATAIELDILRQDHHSPGKTEHPRTAHPVPVGTDTVCIHIPNP